MPLSVGDQLGPYVVTAPIGAGGMGEVYKAKDTRLDRSVALKVLPEHIAKRDDLRARFEREARAVASLNHPNICTLYDIGNQDGVGGFMVMELIEGESLAARIEKGPIPLDQSLNLATQIADALDRAHRAGVTHRDVKPQNIMLTRDGVKVLDFGLAKSQAKPGPTEETLTAVLTTEGTVMGTPQYMAPEQFAGKEADARSDIWAFGAVLYEMVTGQKAFQGKSYSSLVGAILSADPAPMAVKPFTPAWLERLVRRCLAKDPEDRYQSMRDVVIELKSPPAEVTPAPAKRSLWWPVIATGAILAAVVGWALWIGKRPAPPLPVAFEIPPPKGSTMPRVGSGGSTAGGSAISPDGRTLAFVATNEKGVPLLFVRPLESLALRALAGTEGAGRPFWSPDSKSLAFFAERKLKRIDLTGGVPVTLCDAERPFGGDWNEEGVIVIAGASPSILRVPASGGTPVAVTRVNRESGESRHQHPQFLPGGREFLYWVNHRDPGKSGIAVGSLDGKSGDPGPASFVAPLVSMAQYDAASSRILYMQGEGTLMSRRMELHPARLVGDPVVVAEGVRGVLDNGYAEFSLSRQGTLYYAQGIESTRARFGWRDRSGNALGSIGDPIDAMGGFALSPDQTRVTYTARPSYGQDDVWVMDLVRGLHTRISFNHGTGSHWSPDGKLLYFSSPNLDRVYRKPSDGSGEEVVLTKPGARVYAVSPDGKTLLIGNRDIMKLPLAEGGPGEAKPEEYLKTIYQKHFSVFSPDGRWVAYRSNESGRYEIYIQGYPDKRGKWLVSGSGGEFPAWRQDGKELYWGRADGMVMAATIELGDDGVRLGRPQPLFQLPLVVVSVPTFQPSRDGQRFLVYEPVSGSSENEAMVVVQNWAAGLER